MVLEGMSKGGMMWIAKEANVLETAEPKDNLRRYTVFGTPINPLMGEGRYQDSLRRLRDRISKGIPLEVYDCTDTGYKETHCSWGFCSKDKEQWPQADDHIFPDDFAERGRISVRGVSGCPLDRREKKSRWGCFYACMIFSPDGELPYQDQTIKLFDGCIKAREDEHGVVTTDMDNESWRVK